MGEQISFTFEAIDTFANEALDRHMMAAVDGDERAAAVLREAKLVRSLTDLLRKIQPRDGDLMILNAKVESLREMVQRAG